MMSIGYLFMPNGQDATISNLDNPGIACAGTCSVVNELVNCQVTGKRRRRGVTDTPFGKLYLCTDEVLKSSRLFREKVRAFSEMAPFVGRAREEATHEVSNDVNRLIHNLITLNAQTIQAVYRVVPQDDFNQKDRESLIRAVAKKLSRSTDQTASLVISLLKNANLEKTEFAVYRKLVEKEPVNYRSYPIHKVLMLVLNTYWNALRKKELSVRVGECTERVRVDYDTIVASLVHLFDNTSKYALPKSRLDIVFEVTSDSVSLVLDMVSLRIGPNEVQKIFDEGFSGDEPRKIDRQGEGRGLYLVERLLRLSDSALKIERDVSRDKRVTKVGVDFENNVFRLSMPRA